MEGGRNMIFVTGDCHADFHRFTTGNFPEQAEMTREDYVIVCGDFGGLWWDAGNPKFINYSRNYIKEQEHWLKWLSQRPFTLLFVDGNHENFDLLNTFPIVSFHGGKAHKISENIYHLMRGECFDLNGLLFFTFGGARSHDIQDGIIETEGNDNWYAQVKSWNKQDKMFRVNHLSWWADEIPTAQEIAHANETLERIGYSCDFFVSHCCSTSTQFFLGAHGGDVLTDYFEEIKYKLKYRKHFFGHYHTNRNLPDNEICIYEQIIRID